MICNQDLEDNIRSFIGVHVAIGVFLTSCLIGDLVLNIGNKSFIFRLIGSIVGYLGIFSTHYVIFYVWTWPILIEYCKWIPITIQLVNPSYYSSFDCFADYCTCNAENGALCNIQQYNEECSIIGHCCEELEYNNEMFMTIMTFSNMVWLTRRLSGHRYFQLIMVMLSLDLKLFTKLF